MRLSGATLGALAAEVARPEYDRNAQARGIVHFGIGAFHRAHQAVYTDAAMAAGDRDWAITGVSLRSGDVRDQMNPQDGLYTVTSRGPGGERTRLIGSVQGVLVGPEDREGVVAALAAPETHIASFTVTEKGYCRRADGSLDVELAGPGTIYGFLGEGLARRRAAGLLGLSLVSCDNLSDNGARLAALAGEYLEASDPALAAWARAECAFPATMVDRIVPATTAADREALSRRIGLRDEAAVVTEPFSQWVIEDRFATPRPRWEAGGAEVVDDVRAFETMKLRMLNGAHSALAYLGLRAGHDFVHEAVADPAILNIVERLMRVEAAATLAQDTGSYADALLVRFANPALPHRLAQIAMDGSQKVAQRWLEPLAINQAAGRETPATLAAVAAWLRHVRGDNGPVDDPMADRLAQAWRQAGQGGIAFALFGPRGLFAGDWTASPQALATLTAALAD